MSSPAERLHQFPKKVKAIAEMLKPQDVTQLRAFLGMVQYSPKFLPDLATHLAPLHRLLQKDVKWSWGAAEETIFLVKKCCYRIRFRWAMTLTYH